MNRSKMLILGLSSWIGFLLSQRMTVGEDLEVLGTSRQRSFNVPWAKCLQVDDYSAYLDVLSAHRPLTVLNLLRGEDDPDFLLHQQIVEYCCRCGARYIYASSALALDGYPEGTDLVESLAPNSITPYGNFKGLCERSLVTSGARHLILRFSSIQGCVPHKRTRNELFLEKVSTGAPVVVDGGVIQNRLFDRAFVDAVHGLIRSDAEGVYNFGTVDSSTEVSFLRRQAEVFGWDPSLVLEGPCRGVNLALNTSKIIAELGSQFSLTEEQTLESLRQCEGLKRYINRS